MESAIEQTGVLLPLCDKLIGEPPAKVKVIAALPVAAMYKDYVGLYLASVSQKFPSMVSLRIANMGSEQGRQVMKGNCLECATVLINGKSAFDFGEAPGDKLQLKGPELSAPGVRRALAAGLKEVYGDSVPELPPLPPEE